MKLRSNFFTKEEIEDIHEMTMRALEEVGVEMDDDIACETFRSHGAKVDGSLVRIPREMFESAVASAPSQFEIMGRNGKKVTVGEGHRVFCPVSGPLYVMRGGDHHRNTAQDFRDLCKMDHTSDVIGMLNPNLIEPSDIDPDVVRRYQMASVLRCTDKPLIGLTTSEEDCAMSYEMTKRFYGASDSDPILLGICNPMTPLKYNHTMLYAARYFAERNQPTTFPSCSMPGVTSPVTLSGTLVVNNAEIMAGIVYAQLVREGAPVLYANTSCATSMLHMTSCIGAPETGLISLGAASLAKYYDIPCRTGGSLSDSKCVDWQAGAESTLVMMMAMMSSNSLFLHSCGIMDSFSAVSFEKYLLDEENIRMLLYATEGVSVHKDAEELENILEVGPGGNYIEEDHTFEFLSEVYTPKFSNKMGYPSWEAEGKKDAAQLANEAIDARIASWQRPETTPEQDAVLKEYVGDLFDAL